MRPSVNGDRGAASIKRVCMIGAGSSGIAAAKALHERAVHTIQVDFDDYLHALAKERQAGSARARARGFLPPALCLPSAVTIAS